MKRNKQAVSLITLVITIIVMTIIAGTIILTLSDTNIFNKASETVNMQNEKEEITYIQSKIAFYAIEKNKTFYEFIKQEFGENNVKDNLDDTYTITLESGNSYIVEEKGKIRPAKGIYVEATGFPLMLKDGETVTGTLKATLVDISGKITWSIENESIATISGTTGESITVTAISQGKTKVTATCNGYTKEYIVKVSAEVPLGAYVEYDVSYTDMYQGTQYTKTNGWRYLGIDDAGNKLIVSTAIPALVNYEYKQGETLPVWWATAAEVQADKGIYNTTEGWIYNASGEPNKYATYGLRYKFENIPFTYMETGLDAKDKNTGVFRQIGTITSGININLDFRISGVKVEEVHNLTLAELNRAMSVITGRDRADDSVGAGFKDLSGEALGLFDMQKLKDYIAAFRYMLATPYFNQPYRVCCVTAGDTFVSDDYLDMTAGVRPVIVLSSDVEIIDTDADGIYEIK